MSLPRTYRSRWSRYNLMQVNTRYTPSQEKVKTRGVRSLLIVVPIALVVGQLLLYLLSLDTYLWTVAEDGAYEWATFLVYTLATPIAAVLAWRWLRQGRRLTGGAYVLLALGFAFIAGEEISWGQRIFDFAGPEVIVERNLQSEANLHNLLGKVGLHGSYILVGLWGVGVGRAVARRASWLKPSYAFAPGQHLFWWFLPVLVFYVYVGTVGAGLRIVLPELEALSSGPPRFQECVEFILGVGFLLFVISVRPRAREKMSALDFGEIHDVS